MFFRIEPVSQLSEEKIDGILVLRIPASLTIDALAPIEAQLNTLAASPGVVAIADLEKVSLRLTTPAITLLLQTSQALEAGGGAMVFTKPNPAIEKIFSPLPAWTAFSILPKASTGRFSAPASGWASARLGKRPANRTKSPEADKR